ncbi:hypothetical protein BRC2024_PQPTKSFJ_CDS_0119 [Tegunavirus sp. BRC001]
MITSELVEIFKECRGNFESFKARYAENYSYVAAHFAHRIVFYDFQTCIVFGNKIIRGNIRDEVVQILNNIPDEFKTTLSILMTRIQHGNSMVYFVAEDSNHLRGRSPSIIYTTSDEIKYTMAPLCMEQLDGIPNLYIRKIYNKNE